MKTGRIAYLLALVLMVSCRAGVKHYRVEVVGECPHAADAYTQGLFFNGGRLYESSGLYGKSKFRELDPRTGEVLSNMNFSDKYFMEGSVMLDGRMYLLTWQERVAFVYGADSLEYIGAYSYPRQGWGLTTDGKRLIASDGSAWLYFLDGTFSCSGKVKVTMDGRPVRQLNELEWIDGKVWANVYQTDNIVVIDPGSGKVEAVIDCSGLLPESLRGPDTDVLNGIAYNDGRTYLTGKNWPRIYEIKLKKK